MVPRDSSWFSVFNGTRLVPLRQQPLYTEDLIGLRQLDERAALEFGSVPGAHMQFTMDWFKENVVNKYLA